MIQHRTQLVDLLKQLQLPLIAVEIGVAQGLNSYDLLKAGLDHLFMVDAWKELPQTGDGGFPQSWHDANYEAAKQRVSEFGSKVTILRGLSVEMAKTIPDNSLSLIYIDGDHSYEGVLADLKAWYPKLIKGGVFAGHDYLNEAYGVKKAIKQFATEILETQDQVLTVHVIPEHKEEDAGFLFIKQ